MEVTTNHHNPRVLVVDDERLIADTLTMILAQSGYDTRAAYGGEMALEMARNFYPEMLISDVLMQGINGVEAAIKVREILPGCRILLLSGQTNSELLIESARARKLEFELLAKPVHPSELIAKVRAALSARPSPPSHLHATGGLGRIRIRGAVSN